MERRNAPKVLLDLPTELILEILEYIINLDTKKWVYFRKDYVADETYFFIIRQVCKTFKNLVETEYNRNKFSAYRVKLQPFVPGVAQKNSFLKNPSLAIDKIDFSFQFGVFHDLGLAASIFPLITEKTLEGVTNFYFHCARDQNIIFSADHENIEIIFNSLINHIALRARPFTFDITDLTLNGLKPMRYPAFDTPGWENFLSRILHLTMVIQMPKEFYRAIRVGYFEQGRQRDVHHNVIPFLMTESAIGDSNTARGIFTNNDMEAFAVQIGKWPTHLRSLYKLYFFVGDVNQTLGYMPTPTIPSRVFNLFFHSMTSANMPALDSVCLGRFLLDARSIKSLSALAGLRCLHMPLCAIESEMEREAGKEALTWAKVNKHFVEGLSNLVCTTLSKDEDENGIKQTDAEGIKELADMIYDRIEDAIMSLCMSKIKNPDDLTFVRHVPDDLAQNIKKVVDKRKEADLLRRKILGHEIAPEDIKHRYPRLF